MRCMLWATDGSVKADEAGKWAEQLLHVFPDSHLIVLFVMQEEYDGNIALGVEPEERELADELRASTAERFRKWGTRVEFLALEGAPVFVICDTAKKRDANLILVGSHGRNILERVLIGSVSHGLIQHADRPVLVVR